MTTYPILQIVHTDGRFRWRLITAAGAPPQATCGDYSHGSLAACRACASSAIRLARLAAVRSRPIMPGRYGWSLSYGDVVLARSIPTFGDGETAVQAGEQTRRHIQHASVPLKEC
jgi:hypothetical protein